MFHVSLEYTYNPYYNVQIRTIQEFLNNKLNEEHKNNETTKTNRKT